jgi:predicted Zn-dependent protease
MRPRCSSARTRAGPLALALALGGAGCATPTPQQEAQLGARLHAELGAEGALVQDRVVAGYVDEIGRRLAEAAGVEGGTEYRFFVVADPEINAFAAPGGAVYVNAGTIRRARNVSELAGVLAHEVGHVARRHVAENLARRRTVSVARDLGIVAAAAAAGPAGASAASLLGGIASLAALNSFGREAEREADAFAVEILPRAGYDPEGLLTFFHTLMRDGGAAQAGFLSSHPATEDRIAAVRARIDAAPLPERLRSDDGGRLEIIQRRVELLTGAAAGLAGAPPPRESR